MSEATQSAQMLGLSAKLDLHNIQVPSTELYCTTGFRVMHLSVLVWSVPSPSPLSSTWPHLNSDVGLEKGEY